MGDEPTLERMPRPTEPIAPRPPRRKARPPRRTRRKLWGCLRTGLIVAAMVAAALIGAGLVAGVVVYNSLAGELADDMAKLDTMEGVEDFETTRIYDRSGEVLLYELFGEGRRTEVDLDQIPFSMRWATIATEDDTFYENPGFDPPSIARAAYDWYRTGEIVSGGSTITQQLVRQIVFDYEERTEQTLRRKFKEAALAWVMTQKFDKDEILELYLNEAYYGNLAYGVEEASAVYFDKHASELTIAEAAFLAGLPQAPGLYDPYTDFATVKARQRQVLDLMVRHGFITAAEADEAFNESPTVVGDLASPNISLLAPHFTVEVRRQLAELPGIEPEMLDRGGLVVTTTIDMDMQSLAEDIVAARVAEVGEEFNMSNAALVALQPVTGEVLAMVGSVDYDDEAIDGAVNNILSEHQPGSTMKPLTYAAALEQGWTAADVLWDVPMVYGSGPNAYQPVNYDGRFHGPVRLRDALANSYNIPAVTLAREVGVENLLAISKRFGIDSLLQDPSQYGLSLTLGGGEVMPLEMARAFSVFANGGRRIDPVYITRVEDNDGNVLYEAPGQADDEVLDERIAYIISDILSDNAARTPAMGADSPLLVDFPAAVKTGTTNDYRDNWTIGYTPQLVVAVWAGNTDNSPMAEGTSGLTGAAPIWHDYMTEVMTLPDIAETLVSDGVPPLGAEFERPDRLENRQVCVLSSLSEPAPAEEGCPQSRGEWFRVGGEDPAIAPTEVPTATPVPTRAPRPETGDDDDDDEAEEPEGPMIPARQDMGYGVLQIGVLPLDDEDLQAEVVATLASAAEALPDGTPGSLPPRYCEVDQQSVELEGVAFQIFIAAPTDPVDAVRARNWALENGVPIEPGVACPGEVIEEVEEAEAETPAGLKIVYGIREPAAGQEVSGILPVIGTALFDSSEVEFYKVEIGAGRNPSEFVTIGEVHREPVDDDVLEMLHAEALPPGPYVLQLVLVPTGPDAIPPFQVPIEIVENSGE